MPQGSEGLVAKVEIWVGRVWDQSVVLVWERKEDVAAVNQSDVVGWSLRKGSEMKPVVMLDDSQWIWEMRLSVVWKRNDVLSRECLLASLRASMRAGRLSLSLKGFSAALGRSRAG